MIDINLLLVYGATYKKYELGETVFSEGFNCYYYNQLVEGQVLWQNLNEEGKEFIQEIIEPGECFGELPLFDDLPYAATSVATKNSLIIRLPKDKFKTLLSENSEIHFAFNKLFVQRLRFKFLMMKIMAYENPEIRITTLLKYLKEKHHQPLNTPVLIDLTRKLIAEMTGLRIETVIRSIKHLNEEGELTIVNGKVYF